jgi:uncharacterized protein (TIGR00661 family)
VKTFVNNKARVLFAVQGEGRGHLSQAIVSYELLKKQGYEVSGVIVGGSKKQSLPAYFRKRILAPVYRIESPCFKRDKNNRGINLLSTIFFTIRKIYKYKKSVLVIREIIKRQQPDIIINFYEPMIGVAHYFKYISTYTISVAHQYLFLHPDFLFPPDLASKDKWMLKQYTKLTAAGSKKLLALSFKEEQLKRHNNIIPCPPFLRSEIKNATPFRGTYLLVYIVNAGYMDRIIEWHNENPDSIIHCFTDSKKVKDKWEYNERLTFHSLNDQQFIRYMINAAAVITTAGFESVCEAFYLNKPVLMIPVEGHAEQKCNAFDGERAGAGIHSPTFNLTKVKEILLSEEQNSEQFKRWTNKMPEIFFSLIREIDNSYAVSNSSEKEIYSEAYSME